MYFTHTDLCHGTHTIRQYIKKNITHYDQILSPNSTTKTQSIPNH